MSNYDDLPCSVYVTNRIGEPRPIAHENRTPVVHEYHPFEDEDTESYPEVPEESVPSVAAPKVQKPIEKPKKAAPAPSKKKSCLTSSKVKSPPPHPALRKKTVAFGKTVNVSQTVEGTSRAEKKKMAESSNSASKNNKDEEWRKVMKEEIETIRNEFLEETQKRDEKHEQHFNSMQQMMEQLMKQLQKPEAPPPIIEKENVPERNDRNNQKISNVRKLFRAEGRLNDDAITILESRARNDPIFRQQVDDVLADAEYEANRKVSIKTPTVDSRRNRDEYKIAEPPNALMKETLTVERSIRFDNGMSIDSRKWLNEMTSDRPKQNDHDNWQEYDNDALHSTYQPGNSISYYPSAVDSRKRGTMNENYYVEHVSDQEDLHETANRTAESRADRERRIREKYSRRNK